MNKCFQVNPCPDLDDEDCRELLGSDNPADCKKNGLIRASSTISLHDRVVDLGYDPLDEADQDGHTKKAAVASKPSAPGDGDDKSSDEDDDERDLLKKRRGVGSDVELNKDDDDEEDTFKRRRERLAEERLAKLSTSSPPPRSGGGGGGGHHGGMRRPHQYRV